MKIVVLRSLLIALVLSLGVALVDQCWGRVWIPTEVADDSKLQDMTLREVQAYFRSHQKEVTKFEWVLQHIGEPWFWKGTLQMSIIPFVAIFGGCLWLSYWRRKSEATNL